MSKGITLEDYERTEATLGVREARRGLVIHGLMAILSVMIHAALVLRARRSIERRQARIEYHAIEEPRAA